MTEAGPQRRRGAFAAVTPYVVVGLIASVVTFLGFSRTWFLRWMHDLEPLAPLVHAHGATMVAWYLLFLLQAWSAATGRMGLHQRLGRLGWPALVAALATGIPTLFHGIEAGNTPVPPAPFLAISALLFVQFAVLASWGLASVARPDVHKRLMLIALLSTLSPALTRLPWAWLQIGFPLSIVLWANALPFAALFWDRWRNKVFHPAYVWGVAFLLGCRSLFSRWLEVAGGPHLWRHWWDSQGGQVGRAADT